MSIKTYNKINDIIYNLKIDKKFWFTDFLTGEDYDIRRSKPAEYIKTTIKIAKLLKMKNVVEIGSTRFAITKQCIEYFDSSIIDPFKSPPCCCDGHSTYFWAKHGFETHTVDIDQNCSHNIINSYKILNENFPNNLHLHIPMDGLEFLNNFKSSIDILYLDGWDKGTPDYAENHLKAFLAAEDKMSAIHLVLIDDTDFVTSDGGKDKLLSPFLIENNYRVLFNGRQTLFINQL
jgi:hypothetical protein